MLLTKNLNYKMLSLHDRQDILSQLGERLLDADAFEPDFITKVGHWNPWFTPENIHKSVKAIAENYLAKDKVADWISSYNLPDEQEPKKIGLILAGNIPLVGIHDIIATFVAGHHAYVKLSEKDDLLLPFIFHILEDIHPDTKPYFNIIDRLISYDAIIATGSNTSKRYFEKYFTKVPSIIRANRNGVAVIYKDTIDDDLVKLGTDILGYFGLGCRNVSKLYIEEGLELKPIFLALERHRDMINHNKYKNNYDYNHALYLMNQELFHTNDFLFVRPAKEIQSRIAAVHYEHFDDPSTLQQELSDHIEEIQCIVSDRPLGDLRIYPFGESQSPALTDYADGVDTLDFLSKI